MTVSEINIFPIKSLPGISLQSSIVTPKGLQFDRRFMLVDEAGMFITQRTHPELTAFSLTLDNDVLVLTHPSYGPFAMSIHPPEKASIDTIIWDDTVHASHVSKEADHFFSDVLGSAVQLVGMPDTSLRRIEPEFSQPGEHVSFADGYPMLVLGTASVDELNSRLDTPVPSNRFRASLMVSGCDPWEEDEWKEMHFGEASLKLVKQCARCIVIQTDQQTGERGKEPTKTLLTYRKKGSKVVVGMNTTPLPSAFGLEIRVGDSFDVSD